MSVFENGVREMMRFADYRGRSSRTDLVAFWLVTFIASLALLLVTIILEFVAFHDPSLTAGVQTISQWLVAIPMIALFARRLHDRGLSGWWVALCMPAAIQNIVAAYQRLTGDFEAMLAVKNSTLYLVAAFPLFAVFILLLLPGEERANRYGPLPRYDEPGEPA